jgi:hypothetical protein
VKYVLMFVETEEYAKELEAMAPDERDRAYQRVMHGSTTTGTRSGAGASCRRRSPRPRSGSAAAYR